MGPVVWDQVEGGGVQGEGLEKVLLCKRGGPYMKNKNKGGVFCQLNLISNKGPKQKCAKQCKKIIKH